MTRKSLAWFFSVWLSVSLLKQRYDILITTFEEITENPFGEIYMDLNDPSVKIGI
ncbi:hypothetical protein KOY_05361 [Bacillus cereus VDM021]|nr:hypothetical protein KOY_05361 [Bacillus cereus VDM021]